MTQICNIVYTIIYITYACLHIIQYYVGSFMPPPLISSHVIKHGVGVPENWGVGGEVQRVCVTQFHTAI